MSKETRGKYHGVTVTSSAKVEVDWTNSNYGYTEERLNAVDSSGVTLRENLDRLANKLLGAKTEKERWAVMDEVGLPPYDDINASMAAGFANHDLKDDWPKESPKPQTIPHQVVVGGVYPRRPGSLHTPTMGEILERGNEPDPTAPYFRDADQGGTWVDPLAPYTDFSHDIPQTVDPLRRPKPPTHGG